MKTMQSSGFALTEVLISMILGIFVMGAALSMFVSIIQSNTQNLQRQHLTQDMRAAMSIMSHDIERSGFWGKAELAAFPQADLTLSQNTLGAAIIVDRNTSNIFAQTGNDLVGMKLAALNGIAEITAVTDSNTLSVNIIKSFDDTNIPQGAWALLNPYALIYPTDTTPSNCILLTYDQDNNNTISKNEQIGYRLQDNRIQMYQSGTFACDDGNWEDITDATTQVTALNFTLDSTRHDIDSTGPGTSQVVSQKIHVNFIGQLSNDASIMRTFDSTLRIQNDLFIP